MKGGLVVYWGRRPQLRRKMQPEVPKPRLQGRWLVLLLLAVRSLIGDNVVAPTTAEHQANALREASASVKIQVRLDPLLSFINSDRLTTFSLYQRIVSVVLKVLMPLGPLATRTGQVHKLWAMVSLLAILVGVLRLVTALFCLLVVIINPVAVVSLLVLISLPVAHSLLEVINLLEGVNLTVELSRPEGANLLVLVN